MSTVRSSPAATLIRGTWRDSMIYAVLAEEWTGRRRTT